jgi:hypothetical protein
MTLYDLSKIMMDNLTEPTTYVLQYKDMSIVRPKRTFVENIAQKFFEVNDVQKAINAPLITTRCEYCNQPSAQIIKTCPTCGAGKS